MRNTVLAAIAILLGTLIWFSRARESAPVVASAEPVAGDSVPSPASAPSGRREPRMKQLPGVHDVEAGTPNLDMMGRLSVRHRIAREGRLVYVDSAFPDTDSTVVRWNLPAGRRTIPVWIEIDSLMEGWHPRFLAAALDGMARWGGNPAGVRLVRADSASGVPITLTFVSSLGSAEKLGVTELSWDPSGEITGAAVMVALRPAGEGSTVAAELVARVTAHELGHALGLPHSDRRSDLMFHSSPVGHPSTRDFATLNLLYALPPGTIRIPD